MPKYIPQWLYNRVWPGRMRECPKCGTSFVSKFDKGHCPACYHAFLASEVCGLPPDLTLAQALKYTPEESKEILASFADCLLAVEGFPVPAARECQPPLDREDWEFHRRWLRAAIEEGGTLYAWSSNSPKSRFGGYLVVKDGQVQAMMRTEVFLAD
jgi:hypothetical protein